MKLPARIRGVVTFLAANPPLMFVQDGTGGICVSGTREREIRPQLKVGVSVEVEGITAAGRLVPYITARPKDTIHITVVDDEPELVPPLVGIGQFTSQSLHGDLVEVEGVVRSLRSESMGSGNAEALIVTLASGRDRLEAAYLGWHAGAELPSHLIGTSLRVKGVYNSSAPDRPPVPLMRLLFSNMKELRVQEPAAPPFSLPVTSAAALNAPAVDKPQTRARVQGIVTLAIAGKGMFLQNNDGGVWVESAATISRPGEQLDLVGFPARRNGNIALEDAVWHSTGTAVLPDAPLVTAEQALGGEFDKMLVKMEALVLEVSRLSDGTTLVLQSGERVFLARIATPAAVPLGAVAENSWVRVRGVCVNNRLPGSADHPGGMPRAVSYHLMLDSPEAVDVIHKPSWWTLQRVLAAGGVLILATLAALGWVFALRRRVTRQTALLREHLARETLYEERVRIARELHDSLEQDLLGITLQLNATEKLLTQPDRARDALHLAAAMVRRSQAETHRAVWDLRDDRSNGDGMVGTLRDAVAGLTSGSGPRVNLRVTGSPRPLPPQVENHLLRVALEAVTNAIKYAVATRIEVELHFEMDRIELRVADDGKGFDAEHLPPPSSGHFGLFGMRERAEKLKATLTIRSTIDKGTEIRLTAPFGSTNGTPVAAPDRVEKPTVAMAAGRAEN